MSWLQSPSAVILEPRKIKSDAVSSSISHEVIGPDAMIFVHFHSYSKANSDPNTEANTSI